MKQFLKKDIRELGRLDPETFKSKKKFPLVVVLDNVRSAHNVGAVFRTADAFAINSIYLCGITAHPPHKEIMKTAIGAEHTVDWHYFENTLEAIAELKSKEYRIVGLEQSKDAVMMRNFTIDSSQKLALIVGNEVEGIDQDVLYQCHECIEIEQYGTKHSLNVSVSLGIAVFTLLNNYR